MRPVPICHVEPPKVIRDNDLDPSCGKFRVAVGFGFVACTHFGPDELQACHVDTTWSMHRNASPRAHRARRAPRTA